MAIQQGIWKMGSTPQKLTTVPLDNENLLEEQVFQDMSILNPDWLLIGRQVRTAFDKKIDLLALDANGSVIIIELKRDKTPRDVVAQAIDYASWVVTLKPEELVDIYQSFLQRYELEASSLDAAFQNKFNIPLADVELNGSHQMVIVATELDASTERIINYLNDQANVPINAVFFSAFADGESQYLSRAWMIDPGETQERAVSQGAKEPWNGEYYVSFGHGQDRHWSDAVKYGFIGGGCGVWYSKTLDMLSEGDRVWVNIPKTGYVGVERVTGEKCRTEQHKFNTPDGLKTLLELETFGTYDLLPESSDDEAEYLVPVQWLHAVETKDAFTETGLFGNQNTVCKPRASKWLHTVERLKQVWELSD